MTTSSMKENDKLENTETKLQMRAEEKPVQDGHLQVLLEPRGRCPYEVREEANIEVHPDLFKVCFHDAE